MYKLGFYVPASHLDVVKAALFAAGAGHVGKYENCCWQVLGQGQFRPLAGSTPFLGTQGELEQVPEYRVEMICNDEKVKAVVMALRSVHPYEQPAWDLVELETELPDS